MRTSAFSSAVKTIPGAVIALVAFLFIYRFTSQPSHLYNVFFSNTLDLDAIDLDAFDLDAFDLDAFDLDAFDLDALDRTSTS